MGNTPLTIGLQIDTPPATKYHVAGSILYGKVYLSITGHDGIVASSLRLKVIGKEYVLVHHTTTTEDRNRSSNHGGRQRSSSNSSSSSVTRDHYEQSTHDIWNVDHPLKVFPTGTIPPGNYEFPFSLSLPESLPSTMSSQRGQSTCEIRYEVVAEVFQKPNSFMYSNPKSKKKELNIAAKCVGYFPTTPTPTSLSSTPINNSNNNEEYDNDNDDTTSPSSTAIQLPLDIVPINKCSCCSCTKQGTIALETKLNKTILFVPDTHLNLNPAADVRVEFRCENKSTAHVGCVLVQLIETIEWTSNGHKEAVRKVLAEAKKEATFFPELEALRRKPRKVRRHNIQNNNESEESEDHLLLQYKAWHRMGPLLVPSYAHDTYHRGTAIQVRHILSLQLQTTGWCTTNPEMSSLVELYRHPPTTTTNATATIGVVNHNPCCSYEQQQQQQQQQYPTTTTTTTPSAPFEDEFSFTTTPQQATTATATAPSDVYDYDNNNKMPLSSTSILPTAEAQLVLPDDWNTHAHTADVVNIPMAEATILPYNNSK